VSWVAVAVGGALGSVARHAVNRAVFDRWPAALPAGTAFVNLTGCFVIGLLAGLAASERLTLRAPWREFVFVGLLGGFTTFSTFGLDTFVLTRNQPSAYAIANIVGQVAGGLLAVWGGYRVGWSPRA
jgi:CrcB protein